MIAFASLAEFTRTYDDPKQGGRFDFFFFAAVTSWLLVMFIFAIFFMRLYHRFASINWNLLVSIAHRMVIIMMVMMMTMRMITILMMMMMMMIMIMIMMIIL